MKEHRGLLYGFFAVLVNSIAGALVKELSDVSTATLVFTRFLIAFLFILPWIFRKKAKIHVAGFKKHFTRGATGLISIAAYFYSVQNLPLVNSMTLAATSSLFMPLVVLIWGKKIIPRSRFVALLIGFIGVLVILRPGANFNHFATYVGLMGGIFSAIALYGVRLLSKSEATETILSYYFIIAMVLSAPLMLAEWKPISWEDGVLLIWVGILTFAYQYLITKSFTHAPASKVGSISYLSVIFSGVLGWWFFQEVPDRFVVIGSALIMLGGLLALLNKESSRPWNR